MKIVNIKKDSKYLKEYIRLCSLEWGKTKNEEEMKLYIIEKEKRILNEDKVISILGLIKDNVLLGFISLFRYEDEENKKLNSMVCNYVRKKGI